MKQPQPNTHAPRTPIDLWTVTATEFFHLIEDFKEIATSLNLSLTFVGQLCTTEGHVFQVAVADSKPAYPSRPYDTLPPSLAYTNAGTLMADAARKLRKVSAGRILPQADGTARWFLHLPNGESVVAWVAPQTENEPEEPAGRVEAGGEGTDSAPTPETPACGQPDGNSAPPEPAEEAPPPAKRREPLFFVTTTGEARSEEEAAQLTYNGERIEVCDGYLAADWETAREVFLVRVWDETQSRQPQHVRLYFQSPDGNHTGVSEYRPMNMDPTHHISYDPYIDLDDTPPDANRFAWTVSEMVSAAATIPEEKHGTVVVHTGQHPNSIINTFKVPPRVMPHAYPNKLTVASLRLHRDVDPLEFYTRDAVFHKGISDWRRRHTAARAEAPGASKDGGGEENGGGQSTPPTDPTPTAPPSSTPNIPQEFAVGEQVELKESIHCTTYPTTILAGTVGIVIAREEERPDLYRVKFYGIGDEKPVLVPASMLRKQPATPNTFQNFAEGYHYREAAAVLTSKPVAEVTKEESEAVKTLIHAIPHASSPPPTTVSAITSGETGHGPSANHLSGQSAMAWKPAVESTEEGSPKQSGQIANPNPDPKSDPQVQELQKGEGMDVSTVPDSTAAAAINNHRGSSTLTDASGCYTRPGVLAFSSKDAADARDRVDAAIAASWALAPMHAPNYADAFKGQECEAARASLANAMKDARVLIEEEIADIADKAFAALQPILPGDRVALTETIGQISEMLVEGLEGVVVNMHGKGIAVVAFDKRPCQQSVRVDRLRRLPPTPKPSTIPAFKFTVHDFVWWIDSDGERHKGVIKSTLVNSAGAKRYGIQTDAGKMVKVNEECLTLIPSRPPATNVNPDWSEAEREAIARLAKNKDMSPQGVLRQALRSYQQTHTLLTEMFAVGQRVTYTGALGAKSQGTVRRVTRPTDFRGQALTLSDLTYRVWLDNGFEVPAKHTDLTFNLKP